MVPIFGTRSCGCRIFGIKLGNHHLCFNHYRTFRDRAAAHQRRFDLLKKKWEKVIDKRLAAIHHRSDEVNIGLSTGFDLEVVEELAIDYRKAGWHVNVNDQYFEVLFQIA